jgi:photosystem II CP43 chlorophyll apoprotein
MTGVIKNKMTTILGIHLCLLGVGSLLLVAKAMYQVVFMTLGHQVVEIVLLQPNIKPNRNFVTYSVLHLVEMVGLYL